MGGGNIKPPSIYFKIERIKIMSSLPFQAPPFSPSFMPPFPPLPDDIAKTIKEHVDKRLDEVMEGKDEKFRDKFKHYVSKMMTNHNSHDEKCDYYSEIECLYKKLHDLQKCSHEGKSMIEIEKCFYEDIKDITPEEKRVFSSLLRADGPLSLSYMTGIHYDDFIKHMECLGKKIHEHHHKHKEDEHHKDNSK